MTSVLDFDAAPALAGTGLSLKYARKTVLTDASIALPPASVTVLVGPNGSGKSTLLRALAQLHPTSAGDVVFPDGQLAGDLGPRAFARRVALLAQSRPTPHGIRVREVVGYGRHPHRGRWGAVDSEFATAVSWAMQATGVDAMAERGVDELSGGELQRVWLASCLAQRTGVLLLDEPTTYLDLRYQVELLDLIRDLADDDGIAIGLVLHDLAQAAAIADSVVLLHDGRVHRCGTPADVLRPDVLSDVYGVRVDVTHDSVTGALIPRPVGRHLRLPTA